MMTAALAAGRAAQHVYRGEFEVHRKADESPVTAADHAAEAIILQHLARAVAAVPVVAEEEVAAGRVPAITSEFFLVDPLDGTKEFVARRGDYTVNIALIRAGEPVLGVVYAPARDSLYAGDVMARQALYSQQDPEQPLAGARQSIRVRSVPSCGLTVVASRSHATPETDTYLAGYRVAERVSVGSSLKFCLVAAAQADLYPRLGPTMEWDTAAGHAVLVAAGGQVLAPDGQPLRYGKPGFRNSNFVATGTLVPRPLAA
jgi:3'(2'), 5'-bisphosphate nucleotidase